MIPLRIGNFTFLLEDVGMRNVLSYMSRPNKKYAKQNWETKDFDETVLEWMEKKP